MGMGEKSRPLGLTLVAIYSGFSSLLFLPTACVATLGAGLPGSVGIVATALALITTLLGVFCVASAYGLWTFQRWGRSLTFWLYLASLPLGLISLWLGLGNPGRGAVLFDLAGLAINAVVVWYLATDGVMRLFGERVSSGTRLRQEPTWGE